MNRQLTSDVVVLAGPDSEPVRPQRFRMLPPVAAAALENTKFEPLVEPPATEIPAPTLIGFLVGLGIKLRVDATQQEIFSAISETLAQNPEPQTAQP